MIKKWDDSSTVAHDYIPEIWEGKPNPHPPGACCKDCEHARIWKKGGEDLFIATAVFCDLHQEDFSVTDPACSFWERRKIEKNAESAE